MPEYGFKRLVSIKICDMQKTIYGPYREIKLTDLSKISLETAVAF
jgi:hypothetical protein